MSNPLIRRRPIALGLAVTLVLGACSGSSSPSPSASTGESAAPSAAESAAASASSTQIGGEVSMLGPWGGDEEVPLRAVLKPFEERRGLRVVVGAHEAQDRLGQSPGRIRGGDLPLDQVLVERRQDREADAHRARGQAL